MSFSLRFAFKRSDSLMREFLDVDLLLLQSHPHRMDETGSDRRGEIYSTTFLINAWGPALSGHEEKPGFFGACSGGRRAPPPLLFARRVLPQSSGRTA